MKMVHMGPAKAIRNDSGIREGVNTFRGQLTYPGVTQSQNRQAADVTALL